MADCAPPPQKRKTRKKLTKLSELSKRAFKIKKPSITLRIKEENFKLMKLEIKIGIITIITNFTIEFQAILGYMVDITYKWPCMFSNILNIPKYI